MKKELWFGFTLLGLVVVAVLVLMPPLSAWTNGHLGLLMLSLVVVAIMLGFPTAFTLMGMGVIFSWLAYHNAAGELALQQTLDLMVQRTYAVMTNDVLISVPLFVFMGYLVERANLIGELFKSLHLALARVPGSLAVATLVTCAIFATATGIVGAVVTLMGLLALPAMLKAGYSPQLSAGSIAAGGCLGILIPPSVLLIVYGATAGVSVVQLYAGALFPGLMLTGLYIGYIILLAWLKPHLAPPLSASERKIPLPAHSAIIQSRRGPRAAPGLLSACFGCARVDGQRGHALRNIAVLSLPLLLAVGVATAYLHRSTPPSTASLAAGLQEMGTGRFAPEQDPAENLEVGAPVGVSIPPHLPAAASDGAQAQSDSDATHNEPVPRWFWITLAFAGCVLLLFYAYVDFARLEVYKMLLKSVVPLAGLVAAVLGSIVFGLATPTEAAAIGSVGGFLLAAAYRRLNVDVVKNSVFLTARTTAMVCWLFVGSSIFSAAFALLGGQALVEAWVLSLDLTPVQFLILAQVIIFLLGWPLEWTEIIVIFMPIFVPLLSHFQIDPLFFGLLVAVNLQTAFLSPPVAMAAFYIKGVAPPGVTLNQIFVGMLPFMGIQILMIVLLYTFPSIGLWLPQVLYK